MNKSKIIQLLIILAAITVIASGLSRIAQRDSLSLAEYAGLNESQNILARPMAGVASTNIPDEAVTDASDETAPNASDETAPGQNQHPEDEASSEVPQDSDGNPKDNPNSSPDGKAPLQNGVSQEYSVLTGALLNGDSQVDQRVEYQEGFYYEPLSDRLCRYITGVSYPSESTEGEADPPAVTLDQLRYVHVLHYDFEGNSVEGELICNAYIAQDLVEIFYELHRNEYCLEKVLLIDEYGGDDTASMTDNNTSCFNYRTVEGTQKLSRHAYGMAVDVNPLYNPYITYEKDGTEVVSPAAALDYADRSARFAYKIDENDLCYRLFTSHGFTWGGSWNQSKDYQHFQKALP